MSNLQHIETFIEVSSRLSFARAAESLRLPASTATSRVRALEDSIGVRLLERTTRSVSLTPEGAVFLDRCKAGLEQIEAARALISPDNRASGLIRLSVPSAFPKNQLADLCRRFLEQHPLISLDVSVSDEPADFIRDGIDLALRGNTPGGNDVIARLLSRTQVVLASPLGRADDNSLPVLGPLTRHLSRSPEPGQIHCQSFELAYELALAGIARACLPLPMCKDNVDSGVIETGRLPKGVPNSLALYLVYQDRRHQPRRIRLLIDFLIAELV